MQMTVPESYSMLFPYSTEDVGSLGDGQYMMPKAVESFHLRPDYYRNLQRYYAQSQGGSPLDDIAFVSIDRLTSFSAVSREGTLGQIDEFLNLEDGWDGYGGYSPSNSACGYARAIVTKLATEFPELPSPEINPTPNGTLTLSWDAPLGHACIEVGDENFSAYLRYKDNFFPIKGECSNFGADELQLISVYLYQ